MFAPLIHFLKKGLKDMFSQIRRSAGRVPPVRKRKSGLGPFKIKGELEIWLEEEIKRRKLKDFFFDYKL